MDPGNSKIVIGLLRCLIQLNQHLDAKEMIESLDDELINHEEIIKIKKLVEKIGGADSPSIEDLKLKLNNDLSNLEIKFQLAEAYFAHNDSESGFVELLEIFKINSKWNDEAAKKKLLEYFDLLGPTDLNVINARRKL
jgi:putative thioredoxin